MRRPSRFRIGLLFLLGLGTGVGVLIWIGAAAFDRDATTYDAYFDSSVRGLRVGTDVSYRGIRVGQVKSVELGPDRRLVKMEVTIQEDFPLRGGLALSVGREGLMGSPYVTLAEPPEGTALIEPPFDFEVKREVIPTYRGGGLGAVATAVSDLADQLGSLPLDRLVGRWASAGEQLDRVLANDDIDHTFANLRVATARAREVLGTLAEPETRRDARRAVRDLAASAGSLREASRTASRQLDALPPEALGELSTDMRDAVTGLQDVIRRIDAVVPQMGELVRRLRLQPGQITVRREQQEPFDR